MATSPTDKPVQEEDEVRTEEVDPAKKTDEELDEEAMESFLRSAPNQNRQEGSITIGRSGETMERCETSFASDQNPFLLPPQEDVATLLSGIQYETEEDTCGLLGFSPTIHTSGQMMEPGSTSFASDQNRALDSNPNTSDVSLSIQDQETDKATENQNPQDQSITQERSVAPVRMMPYLRPSVPQAMMLPEVNIGTQPQPPPPYQNLGSQKRNFYEVGESSSSRKRQNVVNVQLNSLDSRGQAPRMPMTYNQEHGSRSSQPLWQVQAPGVSEAYQEYLQRLGGSPRPELNPNVLLSQVFSAINAFHQGREYQRPIANTVPVRPIMDYNNQQQHQLRQGQQHQASPSAAAPPPPRPEQNQQLQPQTQQPRQPQGSNADEPSSSGQNQG